MSKTKAQQKAEVTEILRNPDARHRAVVYMWLHKQTEAERRHGQAYGINGKGFDKWDKAKLSRIASQLYNNKGISPEDEDLLEHRIGRYWKQLHWYLTTQYKAPAKEATKPETVQPQPEKKVMIEQLKMIDVNRFNMN